MQNPYLPYPVRIDEIIIETEDKNLKTFKLVFLSPEDQERFDYRSGQFAELSVTGKGEIPIGIASSPTEKGYLKFTVNKVGLVSSFLHAMKAGDIMGVRGPLGNWFPWEEMAGKNVVIVGGGFAFTTLRSSIVYMLDNLGYDTDHIIMSFESRMKCGIGMCGRCNIGKEFVCKDGPIFTLAQLDRMPKEY